MQELDDSALLRQYVEHGSEAAFSTLVSRHIDRVYSVALRCTGNPSQAEEITQAVFVILARKSRDLGRGVILYSWLYRTAQLTSAAFIRGEVRRSRREYEAYMQTALNENKPDVWPQIAPLLDAGLASLNEADRRALVLRFFYDKSMREIGTDLNANEDAVKKRMGRALERLKKYFSRRGVDSTSDTIAESISKHSVQAAPVALAKSVTALALAKGAAASTSTLTLINGALKIMAWTKIKTAAVAVAAVLLAGGTTTVVVTKVVPRILGTSVDESFWQPQNFQKAPPVLILRPVKKATNISSGITTGTGKTLELNYGLKGLLATAYEIPAYRMVLPDNLPTNHYDLLLTLNDHPKEALQAELRKRFGLVVRIESLETNEYTMKIASTDAPGLVPSRGGGNGGSMGGPSTSGFSTRGGAGGGGFRTVSTTTISSSTSSVPTVIASGGNGAIKMGGGNNSTMIQVTPSSTPGGLSVITVRTNRPARFQQGLVRLSGGMPGGGSRMTMNDETLANFAKYLEPQLGEQVVDQTGKTNTFDIKLLVQPRNGETRADALKRSVLEQLGLELVPGTDAIDTLVVNKAR